MKSDSENFLKFPDNFLWGAATAAHQVEGGMQNNLILNEDLLASIVSRSASDRLFKQLSGRVVFQMPELNADHPAYDPKNYISGRSVDHYRLFEQDFRLAKNLKHNAHRLSIEWSRVEPKPGVYDQEAIAHYREVLQSLKDKNITVFVTIWHFTLPEWFVEQGGWLNSNARQHFFDFVKLLKSQYDDLVKYWVVINEPLFYIIFFYLTDYNTGRILYYNIFKALRIFKILLSIHKISYQLLKTTDNMIGVAQHYIYFSKSRKIFWRLINALLNHFFNFYFQRATIKYQDYIGVNYYFCSNFDKSLPDLTNKFSDLGWGLYPKGLYYLLLQIKKFNKPIIICEHGLADHKDVLRNWYIKESLYWIHKAIGQGSDVRGYLHWSLLDNYEWDKGFWPKFGLIAVDRTTQKRIIRNSALEYSTIIEQNGFVYKLD